MNCKSIKTKLKVERFSHPGEFWYEVMLSPFDNFNEVESYINKYGKIYNLENRQYKITLLYEEYLPEHDSKRRKL